MSNNFGKVIICVLAFFTWSCSYLAVDNTPVEDSTEGAVYVATNKSAGNTVVGYSQNANGELKIIGEFSTGGKGTGNVEIFPGSKNDPSEPLADGVDPLISAYGVFKTDDDRFVLVVNAQDGSLSSLRVDDDYSLSVISKVSTRDPHPLSIASHGNKIYVASAGEKATPPFSGGIEGYRINKHGLMEPIKGSSRVLGGRPTAIQFTEDGEFLFVVELVTGMISVYEVFQNGNISSRPVSTIKSPHDVNRGRWMPIPVGIDIVKKRSGYVLLVSEARFLNNKGMLEADSLGQVPQAPKYKWQTSSTSSYFVSKRGEISLVSADVLTGSNYTTGQIANCWVEVSHDGAILWAANALSSSISSYSIADNGVLTLVDETAFKDQSEKLFFGDLYLSKNGRYLNQLISNQGEVMVFKIHSDGGLTLVDKVGGLPDIGSYGIVTL